LFMLDTKPLPPDLTVRRAAADRLTMRRIIFAGLVLATILALMGLATHALLAGGLDAPNVVGAASGAGQSGAWVTVNDVL
jgi:hypothetical protein